MPSRSPRQAGPRLDVQSRRAESNCRHPWCFDILPALKKGGDSLSRCSMSRTEEDISSRVDVPIMRNTTPRTYPASYSELCDTFRPRLGMARRTDSGRERFIHFLVPSPVRGRFVAEHASEGRPAYIAGEVRAVLDLAFGERHPAQRAPAAQAQERAVSLTAGLGVLLAHGVEGARMQGEILAAPRQRLDAVSIRQQHRRKLKPSQRSNKTLKLTKMSVYRNTRSPPPDKR